VVQADQMGALHEGVANRRLLATALLAIDAAADVSILVDAALATAVQFGFDREAALLADVGRTPTPE